MMIAETAALATNPDLVEQHLPLAQAIALRLKRRYIWLDMEDLYSYSLFGLTKAASQYKPNLGVSFRAFAVHKAMYLAIDEMRHDRMLRRKDVRSAKVKSYDQPLDEGGSAYEAVDPHGQEEEKRMVIRDMLEYLLCRLRADDRRLLQMYYSDELTMAEIGEVLGISQSAVCVRHGALIRKLQRRARQVRRDTDPQTGDA